MAWKFNPYTGQMEFEPDSPDTGGISGDTPPTNVSGGIGGTPDSPLYTPPPPAAPAPAPAASAPSGDVVNLNPNAGNVGTVTIPTPGYPGGISGTPGATTTAPATDTGAATAPGATTTTPPGTGFTDPNDYWRGLDASGQRIDPATLAEITDPGQLSYYSNDQKGQQQAYARELFRRYGALNNQGDSFRNYLLNQAGRVTSGFELAQAIPGGENGSTYHQDDFLGYLRNGLASGSVFDPNAMGAGLSTLLDYIDRANDPNSGYQPGENAFLKSYASDPETARDDLYRWGLLTLGTSSPLYRWAQSNPNRNLLLNQLMPQSESYANYVRTLFGVAPGREVQPFTYGGYGR
jgi:hypothetical protein